MIISPFTPLQFTRGGARPKSDGLESRYVQVFAPSDRIAVECFCSEEEQGIGMALEDVGRGKSFSIEPGTWDMADGTRLAFAFLSGLDCGAYRLSLPGTGMASREFRITDDESELSGTALIQYSMKDNRRRSDGVWLIDGMRHFFDFRVPGGFKDSDIAFGCEAEQFVTQMGDPCTLYSLESTIVKFTLGGPDGVPAWFGEMLNRLLCCTYVYFDGERYARKDASVPECSILMEGLDSFVFKQSLQKVAHLNPAIENDNLAIMRRAGEAYRAETANNETTNRKI